jgi:ribosomal protein S18 acetylase RimI-like enzyme
VNIELPSGMTVKRLSTADAEALGRFFELLAADPDIVRFFHPHPLTQAFAASLCSRQESCRDRYFVMQYCGRFVAYSMLRGWDEGYAIPSFGGSTHPELRGAGLGRLLLLHAIVESRTTGANQLRLTVYKDNVRAVHLYRTIGFTFSDKNEHEFVGLFDLSRSDLPWMRGADETKLVAWLKREQTASCSLPHATKRSA